MELIADIPVRKVHRSRLAELDFNKLEFGKFVSDHMLVCDYKDGKWDQPLIMPYAELTLAPTALALHYGQTVFEGMKAFRMMDGKVNIFRIHSHFERFNRSLKRMCMPEIPQSVFIDGLSKLIDLDRDWVPGSEGSSLYIRPFMIATEARFGVKVSEEYRFIIFSGPVPALYKKPIKVKVETRFIRAARGGTGYAKCGGNYGGAFYPTMLAREEGYEQVLWTDARNNELIEESGMMNVMFVIDGVLRTAPLSDTILDGITRNSLLKIAIDSEIKTLEKAVSIHELKKAFAENRITEAFGVGTAAIIAPIGAINIEGVDFSIPPSDETSIQTVLKSKLERMRSGIEKDVYRWNFII